MYSGFPSPPCYSIGTRLPGPAQSSSPPCSAYLPKLPFVHVAGPKIVPSSESVKEMELSPGPGDYNIDSQLPKGVTFPRSKRMDESGSGNPGPATYHIPREVSARGVTIQERNRPSKPTLEPREPGPQSYCPQLPSTKIPPSFPISSRTQSTRSQDHLGPGTYDHRELRFERVPVIAFPKYSPSDCRQPAPTPGPGAYNSLPAAPKRPGFTWSVARAKEKPINVPGPGTY
jgi:hypothetical protein